MVESDHFLDGVRLFNDGRYFEAHEAWEVPWLRASGDERIFLQGLIQLAAAYLQLERGNARGASRLFDASIQKLRSVPRNAARVDLPPLLEHAAAGLGVAKQLHGTPAQTRRIEGRPWIALTVSERNR